MAPTLSSEEYRLLSDQKAADFRSFLQINPGLLAVTGAIFAAGLAKDSTLAIALSAAPLLLAISQLVTSAELQLQLTTYLATFGSAETGLWERDIAAVRPTFWERRYPCRPAVFRPSGWNVWILAGLLVSETLVAFPRMTSLPHGDAALLWGSLANGGALVWLAGTSNRIEKSRKVWTEIWEEHRDGRTSSHTR